MSACALTGIRTPVLALKGLRPSPLDDGGNAEYSTILPNHGQGIAQRSTTPIRRPRGG